MVGTPPAIVLTREGNGLFSPSVWTVVLEFLPLSGVYFFVFSALPYVLIRYVIPEIPDPDYAYNQVSPPPPLPVMLLKPLREEVDGKGR